MKNECTFVHESNRVTSDHWRSAADILKKRFPYTWRFFRPLLPPSMCEYVTANTVYKFFDGLYWPYDMPDAVIMQLNIARHKKQRVILDYGDLESGRSWGECFDIAGYIGNSMGPVKIPTLVYNSRSLGGGAIIGDIVKISTSKGKLPLYTHPNYHTKPVYVAYNRDTWEIMTTSETYNKHLQKYTCKAGCLWINITHPNHQETLEKINSVNKTNF